MNLAFLFVGLVALTRLPFRSAYLFNWDAANFALALQHYDVRLHQPHPPGYPLYVGVAWLFNQAVHEPNASLVLVSVLLECVAVAAVYLLGRAWLGVWPAVAAALALLCSVTFWSYGGIALAYPALAAVSTLLALLVYQTRFEGRNRLVAAAAVYGLGAGFRPDLAVFLLPLLVFGAWRQPIGRLVPAGVVAVGGIALWLVPAMMLSGGPAEYLAVFTAYAGTDVVARYAPTSTGLTGLLVNITDTALYLGYALYACVVLVAGALVLAWRRPHPSEWPRYLLLAVWVAPMGLFYLLVHIGDPGYVFGILPALLLEGASGWRVVAGPKPSEVMQTVLASGMALALLANTMLFFLYERPLTFWGVRQNDRSVAARIIYLRTLPPESVLVVTYDSFKQLKHYLPEYTNSVWLDTKTPTRQVFPVPAGVTSVVLTDPSVFALAQALPAEAEDLAGETWAARLTVRSGQSLVYEGGRLRVEP